MVLRTDLTDDTLEVGVHAGQHNEVNAAVLALQAKSGTPNGTATLDAAGQVPLSQLGNAPGAAASLDSTASDIQPLGTRSAGVVAAAARGDHVHPMTGLLLPGNNLADVASRATALLNLGGLGIQESVNTVAASGAAQTIPDPVTTGKTINYITLTANCTLTFPTAGAGKSFVVAFLENATGGWTVAVPASVIGMPFIATQPAALSVVTFLCIDGTNWVASGDVDPIGHTHAVSGPIAVPTAGTNFLPPMFVDIPTGVVKTLRCLRYKIRAGTSVTFDYQRNGVGVTGLTGLSATTTAAKTNANSGAPVVLADGDTLAPVVTAVSGTPDGLSLTAVIDVYR